METSTLESYVRIAGSDPEDTFRTALDRAGSQTRPDSTGQWMSNCPAHQDAKASLHWFQTANHAVKFNCFAGCTGQEILDAIGLRWYQLRPVRHEFDYYDREGTYRFTVRRTNTAEGDKRFTLVRRGLDGSEESGAGLAQGESYLWLEPELWSTAEDARAAGKKLTVWLPEGEKDAVAIASSGALGDWDFVTSAPMGASNWKAPHTAVLAELAEKGVLGGVVVICDGDNAGTARGYAVRDALGAALPDLPVRVLSAARDDDVADLCDAYGERWVDYLDELSEAEITEALEEGSAVTGFMLRYPLGAGAKPGRTGMAIRVGDGDKERVQPVLAAEFEPRQRWDGGWIVRVTPPRREPVEVVLSHGDLSSKAAFDKWMVRARVAMVPRCGIGTGEVAQALGLWLDWWADTHEVETVTVSEYLTWVDPRTGEPARTAGGGADAVEPVWVSPEAENSRWVRWVGTDRAGCHWGLEGSETDAAWAWARALTFGDESTVAAVAGWAGAMLLSPWLGRWMPTKPGLAVIAPSGSGKTYGAPRLLLQLAGCDGNTTSSVAGLRRRLSQGGVSSIQWIDDSAILDDYHLKEILRVATSQGEHILANPDAGAGATSSVRLVGCIAVSAEGVGWMDEVAMADRFLHVRPTNPQGRRSLRPGHEDELQWPDVQDLMAEYDGELTRVAGWTVGGLRLQAENIGRWVTEVGPPKGRADVAAFCAAVGARAVASWLYAAKAEAGDAWPGKRPSWAAKRYNAWKWLVDAADARLAEARETEQRFNTLVSVVLPAVLRADLTGVSGRGMTSLVIHDVVATDEESMRRSVHAKVQHGESLETALPPVLIDTEGRVWVWTAAVSSWYERTHRSKAESRINGVRALNDQLDVFDDTPEWAHWVDHKGKGRTYQRPGIRIGKRELGRNRAIYRRLSEEASRAVLDGA